MKRSSMKSGMQQITTGRDALQNYFQDYNKLVWLVDWRVNKLPYCTVYVIAPEASWPSKIGIATCARKRVAALQCSHWKRLAVTHCYWAPSVADARKVEKKAHALIKDEPNGFLLGEWFNKKPNEAAEIVRFAALSAGVELNDTIEDMGARESIRDRWEQGLYEETVRIGHYTDFHERRR